MIPEFIWTKSDGRKVEVQEMAESHIRSCINILQDTDTYIAKCWILVFNAELEARNQARETHRNRVETPEEKELADFLERKK